MPESELAALRAELAELRRDVTEHAQLLHALITAMIPLAQLHATQGQALLDLATRKPKA